jgi:erythromycin esterase-like protein
MGYQLGKDLGKKYFAIGTAYGGPSVDSSTTAPAGSVDAAFGQIAASPFILKLGGAPRAGGVAAWLQNERYMRYQTGYLVVSLASAFDAVVYFDRATRAQGVQ